MIYKLCLIHALFAKLLQRMPGMHDETAPKLRRGLKGGSAASNNPFHFHMHKNIHLNTHCGQFEFILVWSKGHNPLL